MSKKRHIGLDKWRLGKLEQDYKKHKKNKKALKYLDEENKVSHRKKGKGSNYCKKLKGEHDFVLDHSNYFKWFKDQNLCEVYACNRIDRRKTRMKLKALEQANQAWTEYARVR